MRAASPLIDAPPTVRGKPRVPPARAASLRLGGVTPFSTVDWPGKLAAVAFVQGCPWRCAYCHNAHLQASAPVDAPTFDEFAAWLRSRIGLLDAVVFSGGEPTAQAALPAAMRVVKALGFAVGLHTAGVSPRRLAEALPCADWVGFDMKAAARDAPSITHAARSGYIAMTSLRLLLDSGVPHEIRTTVHPGLLDDAALLRLADELASLGVRRWVLQRFRPAGCADAGLVAAAPHGAGIGAALVARLRERVPVIELRA
ncbi:MAG TPA: anaerobic ribonucleoside-triphosphate reductase activating protein [Casimicrobiaceae bacterium]|nr:anaerobic ribonucleoside-triphosphate reductase activating protein [Casimicrobiaceae bacterium]